MSPHESHQVDLLLEPVYETLTALNKEYGITESEPVYDTFSVTLTWEDEARSYEVRAGISPDVMELGVEYRVWQDYPVQGRDEGVRLETRDTVGTFSHPSKAIPLAVKQAYEEATAVDEAGLWAANQSVQATPRDL